MGKISGGNVFKRVVRLTPACNRAVWAQKSGLAKAENDRRLHWDAALRLKVQAFTILEVTVAMVLAALSISVAYTAYQIIGRSYQQYDKKNRVIAESVVLDKLLKRDLLSAQVITASTDGMIVDLSGYQVYYTFRSDFVLRDQAGWRIDTFFVQPANVHTFFEGKERFAGERIDKVSFTTRLQQHSVEQVYTRLYSAEELMRLEDNP